MSSVETGGEKKLPSFCQSLTIPASSLKMLWGYTG